MWFFFWRQLRHRTNEIAKFAETEIASKKAKHAQIIDDELQKLGNIQEKLANSNSRNAQNDLRSEINAIVELDQRVFAQMDVAPKSILSDFLEVKLRRTLYASFWLPLYIFQCDVSNLIGVDAKEVAEEGESAETAREESQQGSVSQYETPCISKLNNDSPCIAVWGRFFREMKTAAAAIWPDSTIPIKEPSG